MLQEAFQISQCFVFVLFLILYLYPATYRPEGPWQRLVAAPRGRQPFPPVYPFPTPGIALIGGIVGVPQHPPPPRPARKAQPRQKKKTKEREKSAHKSLVSSIPTPPSPREWARPRVPREPQLPSPGAGGGNLHPHTSWQASLLAAQASARAPWGPLQLAHWVVTCAHPWPCPALDPSTEHWWSRVMWSFAQMAHLGASEQ